MVNPRTINQGIIVPLTGADVDLWGQNDVNPNMVALDGLLGGVQTIPISNANVLLTSPAGFAPTPGPGPTQSQNGVLIFTGTLTADVTVTLPLPGYYIINNQSLPQASTNHVLILRAIGVGNVIGINWGETVHVFNDGTNVSFVNLERVPSIQHWAGWTFVPRWVTVCTKQPYLLCDGTIYNSASFPVLNYHLGATFGGNGATTFGVPDLRGRYPLAYDGTGVRVTVAGSGINGQNIGSAQDAQSVTLTAAQMPTHFHTAGIFDPSHTHVLNNSNFIVFNNTSGSGVGGGGAFGVASNIASIAAAFTGVRVNSSNGLDTTNSAGSGGSHNNMPNTQVTGIWVIRTGW